MSRQTERQKLREMAFANMPLWETWTTNEPTGAVSIETAASMYNIGILASGQPIGPETVIKNHVRMIPRRVRRSMARNLAKRKWKAR